MKHPKPGQFLLRPCVTVSLALAALAFTFINTPTVCPAGEVDVYPGDPNWSSYIPGTGSAGITATNPRSGNGSLELIKGVGAPAFINEIYSSPFFGTYGDLSAFSVDWFTDPTSKNALPPSIALRVYAYDDPRTFFLAWPIGFGTVPTGTWQHADALGHVSIQQAEQNTPPASLAAIPADAPITGMHVWASYNNGETSWHGFVDNYTLGFTGHDPITYNFEVPEPASLATFAALGVATAVAGRNRRLPRTPH